MGSAKRPLHDSDEHGACCPVVLLNASEGCYWEEGSRTGFRCAIWHAWRRLHRDGALLRCSGQRHFEASGVEEAVRGGEAGLHIAAEGWLVLPEDHTCLHDQGLNHGTVSCRR